MARLASDAHARRRPASLLVWIVPALLVLVGAFWIFRSKAPTAIAIAGHSMTPTLWGESVEIPCQDCGYPLRCSSPLDAATITCPNCGHAANPVSEAVKRASDLVQVTPLASGQQPSRWDLVAFRRPDQLAEQGESEYGVKRVVGLPGESISIRGGELFVDGELLKKSWGLFRQLRVEVHDRGYRPASPGGGISAWLPDHPLTGWATFPRFRFQPGPTAMLERLVLERHPAIPQLVTPPGHPLKGIVDYYPANQGIARPRLHQVRDLMIEAQVAAAAPAQFTLEIGRGETTYRATLDLDEQLVLLHAGSTLLASHPITSSDRSSWKVGLALFDGELVLSDDKGICQVSVGMDMGDESRATIMVAARAGEVEIEQLRVWRDVHWLDPNLTDETWSVSRKLAEDEFFLLGDNAPVSKDSRHWRDGIRRADMLGTVQLLEVRD